MQRWSTYSRACTLSSALHTPESPSQNASSKTFSVSGPTRSRRAATGHAGFIVWIAFAAHSAFAFETSHGRKRNWRLRFDFSIVSGSVTVIAPPAEPTPIIAQFLSISQPIAPAPTRRYDSLPSASCVGQPRTHAWASWRLPRAAVSAAGSPSAPPPGSDSSASKYIHCCTGVNLPLAAFITSWPTIPPKKAHIGESSPRDPDARLRSRRSENSHSAASPPAAWPIALARARSSAAAAASEGAGRLPCSAR